MKTIYRKKNGTISFLICHTSFASLNPGTKEPIGPKDLSAIFPMELIKQEVSQERFISIPEEVREIYKFGVLPAYRAHHLEAARLKPRQRFL